MPARSRWSSLPAILVALLVSGCSSDPYEGWPDPATLAPICEQFDVTDDTILEALRPEGGVSWEEARMAVAELEATVAATDLRAAETASALQFPDLEVAAGRLRRGVNEAAELRDPSDQIEPVYGPVQPIELGVEPTIDEDTDPALAFVMACSDRDAGSRAPFTLPDLAALAALGAAAVLWLLTRRHSTPVARTAHTVLGGVLLGTALALLALWAWGAVELAGQLGLTGLDLLTTLVNDPVVYVVAVVTGGFLGAVVAAVLAWRRSRRDGTGTPEIESSKATDE